MLDKNQPLVSVVIPCYNHESFVQKSIQSVIDQTYENIELIIIDDGSNDNSVKKIQEMVSFCEKRFVSFKFIYRVNIGVSRTLNEGLAWCKGDFISLLASDDFYHNDKILIQMDHFIKNKNTMFVVSHAYVVDDANEILNKQTGAYNFNLNHLITFDDIFTFKTHLPITGLYKTELIKDIVNGFDSDVTAEDYDIYLKIAQHTQIDIISEKLYYYRSPEALGSKRKRPAMRLDVSESHLKTINKYKNHKLYKKALKKWNYRRFIAFSGYYQTKVYAFKGMCQSMNMWKSIYFYKAMIRLVFYWKNYNAK